MCVCVRERKSVIGWRLMGAGLPGKPVFIMAASVVRRLPMKQQRNTEG